MPELPEIETIKLQLQKVLVGHRLEKIQILNSKIVQGSIETVKGEKVLGVERLGKVLLINFGQGQKLGFHFKMTGQLIYDDGKERIVGGHPSEDFVAKMPNSHTRVVFKFDKGTLYFNDQRMFGWVMLNPKFVDKLGPEPFDMSNEEFAKRVSKGKRPIKLVLMDQEVISGVGNIYANDALWEAKIRPNSTVDHLSFNQLILLFEKLKMVLREGIKYGGATAADAKYMNLHGLGGHYQDHFRTYGRGGLECLRKDGGIIDKFVLGGRGTYVCPKCQE